MLNSSIIARNGAGRLLSQLAPPSRFNGGTPVSDTGALSVSTTAAAVFTGGLGYLNTGELSVANEVAVDGYTTGGLALSGNKLAVSYANAIAGYVSGLPVDAAGRLCMTVPTALTQAFSSGFSGGFA